MDWRNYLPEPETQIINGVDSMWCTAFATIDAIQILSVYQFQDFTEYDESFTSYLAGTTTEGNNPRWVAEIIKQHGLYPREALLQGDRNYGEVERARASNFTRKYNFNFKEIKQNNLSSELANSPIGVALHAWVESEKGVFVDVGAQANHWTLIVYEDEEYYWCWDSIEPNLKKLQKPWKFEYCLRYAVRARQSNWLYDILMGIWQTFITQRKQGDQQNSKKSMLKR